MKKGSRGSRLLSTLYLIFILAIGTPGIADFLFIPSNSVRFFGIVLGLLIGWGCYSIHLSESARDEKVENAASIKGEDVDKDAASRDSLDRWLVASGCFVWGYFAIVSPIPHFLTSLFGDVSYVRDIGQRRSSDSRYANCQYSVGLEKFRWPVLYCVDRDSYIDAPKNPADVSVTVRISVFGQLVEDVEFIDPISKTEGE